MNPKRWPLAAAILALGAAPIAAQPNSLPQTPPPAEGASASKPLPAGPEGERIINLPSPYGVGGGILQILFTHRFSEGVNHSDFHSNFSFDSQAVVDFGAAYGLSDAWEVSIDRSSQLDDYELGLKWTPFRQSADIPISVALRAGADERTERRLEQRGSAFGQLILGRKLGSRLQLTVAPSYVSRAPDPFTLNGTIRNVWNVPVAAAFALTRTINVQGEYIFRNRDVAGGGRGLWAVAIEKTLLGHRFAFTASNTLATTVDQLLATNSPAGYPTSDVHIGFNLVRQWRIGP
jgi:Membrane bound beta barrel domain (DUF5777)